MRSGDSVQAFYDALAANYTLLFADWRASVRRQGDVLGEPRWLEPEESGFYQPVAMVRCT
jgi:hypothetical protein